MSSQEDSVVTKLNHTILHVINVQSEHIFFIWNFLCMLDGGNFFEVCTTSGVTEPPNLYKIRYDCPR
jgi:hypothetical protein